MHSAKNVALRMILPIPSHQDNHSFQFDADNNTKCLCFPVFFFFALLCLVFPFISLQLINHSNLLSRKDFGLSLSQKVVEGNHIAE